VKFRKSLFLMFAVALLITMIMVAGCPPADPPVDPDEPDDPIDDEVTDQVLQGEGYGYNEDVPIVVEVTMVDGEITAIEIVDHAETEGISDPAFEQIPDDIIAAQSTDVDAVSGATDTSEGIMEAVANATGM